ncbi:hypothetical protein DFH09DRAFT_1341890 [Mycena vulgaris]|nr:hypothetical protein DFH09DRAFT_1341890 [Mycena vulgaris]
MHSPPHRSESLALDRPVSSVLLDPSFLRPLPLLLPRPPPIATPALRKHAGSPALPPASARAPAPRGARAPPSSSILARHPRHTSTSSSHSWHISSSTYLTVARTPSTARLILVSLSLPIAEWPPPCSCSPFPSFRRPHCAPSKEVPIQPPPPLSATSTSVPKSGAHPPLHDRDRRAPLRADQNWPSPPSHSAVPGLNSPVSCALCTLRGAPTPPSCEREWCAYAPSARPPQRSLAIPPRETHFGGHGTRNAVRIYQALISTEFWETVARIPVQIHIPSPTPSSSTAQHKTQTQVRIEEQASAPPIRHHHDLLLRDHTNQPAAAPLPPPPPAHPLTHTLPHTVLALSGLRRLSALMRRTTDVVRTPIDRPRSSTPASAGSRTQPGKAAERIRTSYVARRLYTPASATAALPTDNALQRERGSIPNA